MKEIGGIINFDSSVLKMKHVDGRFLVQCAPTIYEIKKNKKGKLYKKCLSNKQRDQKLSTLLEDFEKD